MYATKRLLPPELSFARWPRDRHIKYVAMTAMDERSELREGYSDFLE